MPSYVFFGFDADTALAGYLFNVIDRAMATALTAFRATETSVAGRWSSRRIEKLSARHGDPRR